VRVAWFGPEPTLGGGVPYAATQILGALPSAGAQVDAYIAGVHSDLTELAKVAGVCLIREHVRWEWGKWYSRNSLLAVTSGQVARLRAQRRLVHRLLANHKREPYDVVYQFSQFESPWSGATAARLPPIIVHPEVHAAGELRWLRRESHLSRQCESAHTRLAVRAVLTGRAAAQRRGVRAVDAFVAPSDVFARDIEHDYCIPRARVHVVPNPIDVSRFSPSSSFHDPTAPLELIYASRIALRKGVELIVALSHRLSDLSGGIRLRVVGDKAMFSDYRPLLRELNEALATYEGARSPPDLAELYRGADILLQPSHYEPFALTVGEALASGLPVVASDHVGAAERVDERVCRVFQSGDLNAFEAATRRLLDDLRAEGRDALRVVARSEAERLFSPPVVASQLVDVFDAVKATGKRRP
jgi:glycosyltransferase involved in cell wall biosynthesis